MVPHPPRRGRWSGAGLWGMMRGLAESGVTGMELRCERVGDTLRVRVDGRLDVTQVAAFDGLGMGGDARHLVVDLRDCGYVSSAGIRVFLRLQRDTQARSMTLAVVNVQPAVYDVFDLTGLPQLIDIRRKARDLPVDGLTFLSAGLAGECYRLDDETVVKLYNEGVSAAVAEQEQEYARAAFLAGVPTALSYGTVTCGTRSGVVYEMLNARPFSAVIREAPEDVVAHARTLAAVAHSFHSKVGDAAVFPHLKDRLRQQIDALRPDIDAADVALLQERLDLVPQADTLVHFDLHSSNLMIRDGEAIVIDMGDVSRGHWMFDLGPLSLIYGHEDSGSSEYVTGVPNALGRRLYEHFLDAYFAGSDGQARATFHRHEPFLASLRLISAAAFLPQSRAFLVEKVRNEWLPRIRAT